MTQVPRIHHVGFVVGDISAEAGQFAESVGGTWDGVIFEDPHQKVRVSFITARASGEPMIELVDPVGEQSPVRRFLQKGGGLHHLCYEVPDLDAHLKQMRERGALLAKPTRPAVAFGGRRIAWMYTRQKLLVEFLEAAAVGEGLGATG